MPLELTARGPFVGWVDGKALVGPEPGETAAVYGRREIRAGRTLTAIAELFDVIDTGDGPELRLIGDFEAVMDLGRGWSSGCLHIEGDVGPNCGAEMTGGEIVVSGSAGAAAGSAMRGGTLRIGGDAGERTGGPRPGERKGMRGGTILVNGSVGADAGLSMRRGLIAVAGGAGGGLGRDLIAGTLVVLGQVEAPVGLSQRRGSIVCAGPTPELLPTFAHAGRFRLPFLALLARHLDELGFAPPHPMSATGWDRYNGDLGEGGRGEILLLPPDA